MVCPKNGAVFVDILATFFTLSRIRLVLNTPCHSVQAMCVLLLQLFSVAITNFIATAFSCLCWCVPFSFTNRKSSLKIAIYRFQPYIRSINERSHSKPSTYISGCITYMYVYVREYGWCISFFHSLHAHACMCVCIQRKKRTIHMFMASTGETVNRFAWACTHGSYWPRYHIRKLCGTHAAAVVVRIEEGEIKR